MALAVNTSHALYSNLVSLVGIDDDGVTVKDFRDAGRSCEVHAEVVMGSGGLGYHAETKDISTADSNEIAGIVLNPVVPFRTPTTPAGTVFIVVNGGYGLSSTFGRHDSKSMLGSALSQGSTAYCALAINKGGTATLPFGIGYGGGPTNAFNSTTSYADASGDVPTSFAVSVATAQTATFYYNGAADGSGSLNATNANHAIGAIGGYEGNARHGMNIDFVWLAVFDRELTAQEISDLHASLGAGQQFALIESGGTGATIGVNDPVVNYLVLEGAAGSADYTISGTYTGDDDTIEYRILDHGGATEVVTWTTLEAATGGAFSMSVSLPRGGWYNVEVRKAADTGVTSRSTVPFGVGLIIGALGQSHLSNHNTSGTGTADGRAVIHDGTSFSLVTTAGAGRLAQLADMVAAFDCPVCWIATGVSGTSLAYWYSSGGGKTANYDTWEAKVTAAGGALSAFVWWQGDFNTQTGDTKATYKAEMDAMFAQLRTDYGASLPVVVCALGRKSGGSDTAWEAIRDAHVDAGDDANNLIVTTIDLDQQVDGQHFTDAGQIVAGNRISQAVEDAYGVATYSRGPVVSTAALIDSTTVDVTVTHDGGTDIAPATGITGFDVLDDGTPVTISSAVRQSANTVRLGLAAPIAGAATLRYGYGAYPDMSAPLVDDTALALPLQSTDADLAVQVVVRNVVLSMIDREGGAPAANLTGLRWAFFDEPLPENFTSPAASGSGASTDGSGDITISVIGTALSVGQVGFLVLSNTDGTLADCHSFAAPVQVSG